MVLSVCVRVCSTGSGAMVGLMDGWIKGNDSFQENKRDCDFLCVLVVAFAVCYVDRGGNGTVGLSSYLVGSNCASSFPFSQFFSFLSVLIFIFVSFFFANNKNLILNFE